MRPAVIALMLTSLLAGCAMPTVPYQYTVQALRDSEAKRAMAEARLECQMAANLPPSHPIIETCAKGVAPDLYQQIAARDDARLRNSAYSPPQRVEPLHIDPNMSIITPQTSQVEQPRVTQPVGPPVNLSATSNPEPPGRPFGTRRLVTGPNGGLSIYDPPQ